MAESSKNTLPSKEKSIEDIKIISIYDKEGKTFNELMKEIFAQIILK